MMPIGVHLARGSLLSSLFLPLAGRNNASAGDSWPSAAAPTTLNVTAISAADGNSTLQCWQLAAPLVTASTPGVSGAASARLGPSGGQGNVSYVRIPGRFNGGEHNAPAAQYVVFLSGLAHVTLPTSKDQAWIRGGVDGLIVAADTAAVSKLSHGTDYPSEEPTTAIQIPVQGDVPPAHSVLHSGPCKGVELPP